MQQVIFDIEQHDRPLLGADRVVEQGECPVQRPVEVQAGGDLGQNMEERLRVLLFTLQLGSTFNHAHLELARQTLRLVEQPPILDGNGRLVGQRAQDLEIVFRVHIRFVALRGKHTDRAAA